MRLLDAPLRDAAFLTSCMNLPKTGKVLALSMVAEHGCRHAVVPPHGVLPFPAAPLSEPGLVAQGPGLAQADGSPFCSPAGQRNRVALWDGGRAEAAGRQHGLRAPGHCGPAPGAALRGHGRHPGGAVGEGDGAGPAGPPCPAAGEHHCPAPSLGFPKIGARLALSAANPSSSRETKLQGVSWLPWWGGGWPQV